MTIRPNPPSTATKRAQPAAAILSGSIDGDASSYISVRTPSGGGFSALGPLALTPWEGSAPAGLHLYLRDLDAGLWWPAGRGAGNGFEPARTSWSPGVFTLAQVGMGLEITLESCVMTDRSAELLRLTVTDRAGCARRLDVTSLAEIVLNSRGAHAAHPAFSKLFLQTDFDELQRCLLVSRRPRSLQEHHPVVVHALLQDRASGWETDRARFLGRGRVPGRAAALDFDSPLSGTVGNVLDPVVALRSELTLEPEGTGTRTFLLGAAGEREEACGLRAGLDDAEAVDRAFRTAAEVARQRVQRLEIDDATQRRAEQLAAALYRGEPALRAEPAVLESARGDRSDLTGLGVDPGRPLAVVQGGRSEAEALKMLEVWNSLGLGFQLAVVDGQEPGNKASGPGLLPLASTGIDPGRIDLLTASADWVARAEPPADTVLEPPVAASPPRAIVSEPPADAEREERGLLFDNGHGGFSPDGREYVIDVPSDGDGLRLPPRPWTNVLANEKFGCLVSETGAANTWYGNSREHRLTPWLNDPLLDPHAEALLLRDEEGEVFSCTPGPHPGGGDYEVRHGQGSSRFLRRGGELEVETDLCVDCGSPVRLTRVRVTNSGKRTRRLDFFAYYQLVLGGLPAESARTVVTRCDPDNGSMFARNALSGPYRDAVAFCSLVGADTVHCTGDGTTFVGRGALHPPTPPAGDLDNRAGAGLDPCFALQSELAVGPDQTAEVWVLLGMEKSHDAAVELVRRLWTPAACEAACETTLDTWRNFIDTVQVQTPAPELDLMLNGWLAYQTVACRIIGRTALYQSGGAYGYRDQLQDSLALLPMRPHRVRRQILLHAAHQFVEGDVLHWWHPPLDRGLRTRFADDLLWLPLAVTDYLTTTGDRDLLDEVQPYLTARELEPGEDEVFLQAGDSGTSGTVYEHCCRALDRSLTKGPNGLPLFGTGDWNDGMNRVGREGRGESVWMGFFLVRIIDAFLPLCLERGDGGRAARYRAYRDEMIHTLNDAGWDGGWYRRGYYDDGAPLGSWENKECAIDALAQSWSVLSGGAPARRAEQAMDAVEEHLIDEENGLIRLLTPPFVDTPHDPGYIRGYVAGVRENGGQYTHAALWVVRAMAALGRRDRAARLLTMLSPVSHAKTPEQVARYQVEPYVIAADVYGAEPHVGRGGWTWYTGSSGWMMRVGLESILGLRPEGDELVLAPCVPDEWDGYRIAWRVPGAATRYEIEVVNPENCSETVVAVECDGQPIEPREGAARLPLHRDDRTVRVRVTLGPKESA